MSGKQAGKKINEKSKRSFGSHFMCVTKRRVCEREFYLVVKKVGKFSRIYKCVNFPSENVKIVCALP